MADESKRKTISLDPAVYRAAESRMKRLQYRKFSKYIADLIAKDARERGPITVVREEDPDEKRSGDVIITDDPSKPPTDNPPPKIGFSSKKKKCVPLVVPPNKYDGFDTPPQVRC